MLFCYWFDNKYFSLKKKDFKMKCFCRFGKKLLVGNFKLLENKKIVDWYENVI